MWVPNQILAATSDIWTPSAWKEIQIPVLGVYLWVGNRVQNDKPKRLHSQEGHGWRQKIGKVDHKLASQILICSRANLEYHIHLRARIWPPLHPLLRTSPHYICFSKKCGRVSSFYFKAEVSALQAGTNTILQVRKTCWVRFSARWVQNIMSD